MLGLAVVLLVLAVILFIAFGSWSPLPLALFVAALVVALVGATRL